MKQRWFLGLAWIGMATASGCGKSQPQGAAANQEVSAPASVALLDVAGPGADGSPGDKPQVGEKPAVPEPLVPVANPVVNQPVSSPAEPDDKTLERTPGLTPPMPQVSAAAPKVMRGLAGAPGASPAMGASDADALVKVFVFSDFQCPVCRRAVEPLKKLVRAHPEVQVIFKQHALASHSRALQAAKAVTAAFAQGKFWELHDRLFDQQSALEDSDLEAAALAVGVDVAAWKKTLEDPKTLAQITYEGAQAEALDAAGTPAFFVNGEKTVGWGSYLGLESQVKRAVEDARALVASGVAKGEVAFKATAAKDPKAAEVLFGN